MASSSSEKKLLRFVTSDSNLFELEESAAMLSQTIKNLLEVFQDGNDIPLPNIDGKTMTKVVDWMKKHVDQEGGDDKLKKHVDQEDGDDKLKKHVDEDGGDAKLKKHVDEDCGNKKKKHADELRKWDENFINVDQTMLYYLLQASHYLEIKNLTVLCVEKAAHMIRGKSPEEIRNTLNIKNDFSPEEKEQIRREEYWAFE